MVNCAGMDSNFALHKLKHHYQHSVPLAEMPNHQAMSQKDGLLQMEVLS